MTIRQLSIFLENKSGRLFEALDSLAKEKINILALTVADTSEYGILRLIVSNPEQGQKCLKARGFSVNLTEVMSVYTSNKPDSLATTLKLFSDDNISIEYMYAFQFHDKGVIVFRTDDRQKALKVVEKSKMELVKQEDLV